MKHLFLLYLLPAIGVFITSCNGGGSGSGETISTDSVVIAKGKVLFTQNCGGCHNFTRSSIGPALGGVTEAASAGWVRRFIQNPRKMIDAGDQRAEGLYKHYKVVMPAFDRWGEEELSSIISYLHIHKGGGSRGGKDHGQAIADPIPGAVPSSGLEVGLRLVAQFPRSAADGNAPLARITKLDFEPGSGRTFVVDLRGKLYLLSDGVPSIYMDIARLRPAFIHEPRVATGFGSFAFHPGFMKNGLLYTSHSERAGSGKADFGYADSIPTALQWVVTEWHVKDPRSGVFSGEGRELLRVNMVTGMHGVQEIAFNPYARAGDGDYGKLYICVGDGAAVEEGYPVLTHSIGKVWGTILRIDPMGHDSRNGRYGIPTDNPFVRQRDPMVLKEIYAYGFRNPHRISWSHTGKMLAVNIGQTNIESVYWIMPGHDYGWPIREGNFLLDPYGDLDKIYPLPADDTAYHITYPIAEYDHDEGKAICGGYVYEGKVLPQLRGKFLFGDVVNGRLFCFDMKDVVQGKPVPVKEWHISVDGRPVNLLGLCDGVRADLRFGRDRAGEMYIMTKTDGKVYKMVSVISKKSKA
ncbi:MAG: PQQ-dependent sugar dehydrogenase [Chitinophagaceae bacterium]|nr:PQQ-dependent sugar dehydrogenase [Chitinophagaceae bacterium]